MGIIKLYYPFIKKYFYKQALVSLLYHFLKCDPWSLSIKVTFIVCLKMQICGLTKITVFLEISFLTSNAGDFLKPSRFWELLY